MIPMSVLVLVVVGTIAFLILSVLLVAWGAHYYYKGLVAQRDKAIHDYFESKKFE